MVLHRNRRMGTGNISETLFALCGFGGPLEKFEVHHVIWDDKKILIVGDLAPTAYDSKLGFKTEAKRSGGLHEQVVILVGFENATSIPERTVHHEPNVMISGESSYWLKVLGPYGSPFLEERIACRLVKIPKRPRIVSRCPPFDQAHIQLFLVALEALRNHHPAVVSLHQGSSGGIQGLVVGCRLLEYFGQSRLQRINICTDRNTTSR